MAGMRFQRKGTREAGRLRNGLERDAPATLLQVAHGENAALPWKLMFAPSD